MTSVSQEPPISNLNDKADPPSIELSSTLSHVVVLLVSGKRANFSLSPDATVQELKVHILNNWPEDWSSEKPLTVNGLKFVHLGKFLEDSHTLKDSKIPSGKSTVVHLNIKKEDPLDNLVSPVKPAEHTPKCNLCSIL